MSTTDTTGGDLPELRAFIRSKKAALAVFMELGAALQLNDDVLLVILLSDIYVHYLNDHKGTIAALASEYYARPIKVELAPPAAASVNGTTAPGGSAETQKSAPTMVRCVRCGERHVMDDHDCPAAETQQEKPQTPQPPAEDDRVAADDHHGHQRSPRPARPPQLSWPNIPDRLTARHQWVLWKYDWSEKQSRWTKVPYQPNGKKASTTDPDTWSPAEDVQIAYLNHASQWDGVGFVLDPTRLLLVGWDFDHCIDADGKLDPQIEIYVRRLDSYTERSPSQTGLRVLVLGKLPPQDRRIGNIEVYSAGRFLSITGDRWADSPVDIDENQAAIDSIHAEVFAERNARRQRGANNAGKSTSTNGNADDVELLDKARAAANGARFSGLFDRGNWQGEGFSSQSEADLWVCGALAFWTGPDAARIDLLFRSSGLMRPKWDEQHGAHTYGATTIDRALEGRAKFYDWNRGHAYQRTHQSESPESPPDSSIPDNWPAPLEEAAFYGPVGNFVRIVGPHTEADPAALLIQYLVAFGNLVGRSTYRVAERSHHYPNLFNVLIGRTGHGRKGSAWAQVRSVMEMVAPDWTKSHIQSGLVSGEGLIWAVRDPIQHREPVKEKGRYTGEYQTAEIDPGVADKRLLVIETEFARVLTVAAREGSTLSATVRQAWDLGDLQGMGKSSPVTATGTHISLVGHITDEELLRTLNTTEVANGLANRILWSCCRRSKFLPRGGNLRDDDPDLLSHVAGLKTAVRWAETKNLQLGWSTAAWEKWDEVYRTLSSGRPGLLGAMLSRAEAQVLRLSIVYAMLDTSESVELPHLKAALAVWRYCSTSVQYVFGDRLGDPDADAILAALRNSPAGLSRTDIRDFFARHFSTARIERALGALLKHNLAECHKSSTAGRPTEIWVLKSAT